MSTTPPLQLRLPDPQTRLQTPPCAAQAKAIQEWITELPPDNPSECAARLVDALKRFDQQPLTAGEYLQVLNSILFAATDTARSLRQEIHNQALPLSDPGSAIAARIRDLHRQLAVGYKRTVAVHDQAGPPGTLSRSELLSALQGAMVYLSELLFDYFGVYQQHESGVWTDLHQLYLYADNNRLLDSPLAPLPTPAGGETSLRRHYLRILLLSLASPYRMRPGEQEWVYDNLKRWVDHCSIAAPPVHESGLGVLTIDLLADEPADMPPAGQAIGPARYRILNTIELLPVLRQELTQLHERGLVEQTSDGGALSPDIYKRLTQAWSTSPHRSFSRSERTSELQVTIGLNSIHRFIEHGISTATPRQTKPEPIPDGQPHAPEERSDEGGHHDIWSLAYAHDAASLRRDLARAPEAHRCGTINESAGGYCLTTHRESNLRARVGELIGVHNVEASHPWEIGVIRWLRGGDGEWVEFGVQMVAPFAQAVQIEPEREPGQSPARQPALLLPEVRAMRQPASLITPPSAYQPGMVVTLISSKGEVDATVARLLEATGSYSLYQFATPHGVMEWFEA